MKKTLIQALVSITLFFLSWFSFSQIDWVSIFKIESKTDTIEKKAGDFFWKYYKKQEIENTNPYVVKSIDSIIEKICLKNGIPRKKIKPHILRNNEVNAFALPDGHLVIYSGLILESENSEALSGVICHEIAHIELKHVMKKLISEVGFSALVSITAGNGGAEVIKETSKIISSTAFERKLEKEADLKAVEYLLNTKINPIPFANFLYNLSEKEEVDLQYLSWFNTHPNSKDRAAYVLKKAKQNNTKFKPILDSFTLKKMKQLLKK